MKSTFFKTQSIAAMCVATFFMLAVETNAADQMTLDVTPMNGMLLSGEKQTTWLRVGVKGFAQDSEQKRAGVNLAIVMDKSGSMSGEKIKRAREAAIDAISLLRDDDIVSIITYDSTVNVLVPATKMTDRNSVIKKIRNIKPGGNTALFAGVSKGAAEVRKFIEKERVNRVILLSDGLANVGPSSPGALGNLGKSLIKENISVSTLGLGLNYNEDLMVQLANTSGGNHLFIEEASELADVFRREFDDVLSVVAQEVDITVTIPEGIRPVRVLGNEADISGQQIVSRLAQVYSEQDRHIVIEVEVPANEDGSKLKLATAKVTYANMKTHQSDKLSASAECVFSSNAKKVAASTSPRVKADVVALVTSEQSKLATQFLDQGNLEEAKKMLQSNCRILDEAVAECPEDSERLQTYFTRNKTQLTEFSKAKSKDDESAKRTRKSFRDYQNEVDSQGKR